MRRSLALTLIVLALGCIEPAESVPRAGALPSGETPLDALSRRHGRLRERLEARGYEELPPTARVFVADDRGVALPLDLSSAECTTIVALAPPGLRDLRLTLYDGEGEEAARDEVPGEGGLVHVCPEGERPASAPFYLAIEARDGAGSVALAQMRSEIGAGDGFEGLFDDVLAPRVPHHDVEARLAETRSAMRSRGLTPLEAPRVEWLAEGAALRMPVRLEAGLCYVAVARGGQGARDVDLYLFDPAGVEVGRDLGADAEPTIEHCVPADAEAARGGTRFMIEARAFEGEGAIGLLVLAAPPDGLSADEPAAALSAREGEHGAAPDLALDVLAADLALRGFAPPVFAARDASIAPGEARTHEVVVGPGCALIVASASHAGMDLDLYLADAAGRELDTDTAFDPMARVRACRAEATVLRIAVKAYGRDGRYAVATLRAPAAIDDVQALRLEEAMAAPRLRGFDPIERFATRLGEGETFAREVAIEPGTCAAIAAAGSAEMRDVDLFLRDSSGSLVASAQGPAPHGTVSRCAETAPLALRLEVLAHRGSGEVAFAILRSRPSPENGDGEIEPRSP